MTESGPEKTILTALHLPGLRTVAGSYPVPLEAIEAVRHISEWCRQWDIKDDHPFRLGKCVQNHSTKKYRILLEGEIPHDWQNALVNLLKSNLPEFRVRADTLRDEKLFLLHLLLHEIGHALHNEWGENECDQWAFEELPRHAPMRG